MVESLASCFCNVKRNYQNWQLFLIYLFQECIYQVVLPSCVNISMKTSLKVDCSNATQLGKTHLDVIDGSSSVVAAVVHPVIAVDPARCSTTTCCILLVVLLHLLRRPNHGGHVAGLEERRIAGLRDRRWPAERTGRRRRIRDAPVPCGNDTLM